MLKLHCFIALHTGRAGFGYVSVWVLGLAVMLFTPTAIAFTSDPTLPGERYLFGDQPYGVKFVDLDADGSNDLVVPNYQGAGGIGVRINDGFGRFGPLTEVGGVGRTKDLIIADLNGDGLPDAATTQAFTFAVSVYINTGNGAFGVRQDYGIGRTGGAIAALDLDGDEDLDLLYCAFNEDKLVALVNNGDGLFTAGQEVSTGQIPSEIVVFDSDSDGDQDVVLLDSSSDSFYVYKNTNGELDLVDIAGVLGSLVRGLNQGDVDGDGDSDLVLLAEGGDSVLTYLNDGSGSFTFGTLFAASGGSPRSSALDDIDSDGHLDLVIGNSFEEARIFWGDGDGSFSNPQMIRMGRGVVAIGLADIDGDGDLDMGAASNSDYRITIMRNRGDRIFEQRDDLVSGVQPRSVAVGDLNNDGHDDIVVANAAGRSCGVFLGSGAGGFLPMVNYETTHAVRSVKLADVDGDGDLDIGAVLSSAGFIAFFNDGHGTFPVQSPLSPSVSAVGFSFVDADGDGDQDIGIVNGSGNVFMHRNDGAGAFTSYASYTTLGNLRDATFGDLNGDGSHDMVAVGGGSGLWVRFNDGAGNFGEILTYATGSDPASVVVGDITLDGYSDVVVGTGSDAISIFTNVGDGSLVWTGIVYRGITNPLSVSLVDFDGDLVLDVIAVDPEEDSVVVYRNSGDGSLLPPRYFVTGQRPSSVESGDFNGDGIKDIAVANEQGRTVSVMLGRDIDRPCPSDLAEPFGALNFFDVLAYLTAFNNADPAADLAAPTGTLNFFDVLAYLTAFNAGCP